MCRWDGTGIDVCGETGYRIADEWIGSVGPWLAGGIGDRVDDGRGSLLAHAIHIVHLLLLSLVLLVVVSFKYKSFSPAARRIVSESADEYEESRQKR